MVVSASVRPSWEELAVDPIHETGPGETGADIRREKCEIEDRHLVFLRSNPTKVRLRSNCFFEHGTQNPQLRNGPGRE